MSLILDALKKLEQDKAAQRSQGPELGDALLRGPRRRSRRGLWIGCALALLLIVGTTLYLVKGRTPAGGRPSPPLPATGTGTVALPAPPLPATAVVPPAPQVPAAPPVASQSTIPSANPAAPRAAFRPSSPAPAGIQGVAPAPAAPAPTPVRSEPARPGAAPAELKVSGIAWSDERAGRRAVVNNLLMAEGETIAGARIVEIRTDRVRFSLNGQTVEAPLALPLPGK